MTPRALRIAAVVLAAIGSLVACTGANAAELHANFAPNRLGASTTLEMSYRVGTGQGAPSSPLSSVELLLPEMTPGRIAPLGEATCTAKILEQHGTSGCPSDSVVGSGSAIVSVVLGSETIDEPQALTIFMAPKASALTDSMIFYATGTTPVITRQVIPAFLSPHAGAYGTLIDSEIPVIAGLPGSPNPVLVSMSVQIDPKGLKYSRREHGRTVTFAPEGFHVAAGCSHGGFLFAAHFSFRNGTKESATDVLPCPQSTPHR